ncbi:MAG: hypothetical protein JNL74_05850 [Fibrobacteres bacterium]|nr:hypothetical protein [Fibrobacterota bacterium]
MKYINALIVLMLLSCTEEHIINGDVSGDFLFPLELNKKWNYVSHSIITYNNKNDTSGGGLNSNSYMVLTDTMTFKGEKWYRLWNSRIPPNPPGSIYSSLSTSSPLLPNGYYRSDSHNNTVLLLDSNDFEIIMPGRPVLGSYWPCLITENVNGNKTLNGFRSITALTTIQIGNIKYDSCWQVNTYDSLKSNIYYIEYFKANVGLIRWMRSIVSNDTIRTYQLTIIDSNYAYK